MRAAILAGLLAVGCAQAEAAPPALEPMLAELAAAHAHGTRDNDAPIVDRVALLDAGELVSFCAEVVGPATIIVDREFDARRVWLMDLQPDADGIHQAHHVVEVFDPDRGRWVVFDIDYGVLFDQPAMSLPAGRDAPEPLEATARDTEWEGGYPLVAEGVALFEDGVPWFDAAAYTASERATMEAAGWRAWPGDFAAHFYG